MFYVILLFAAVKRDRSRGRERTVSGGQPSLKGDGRRYRTQSGSEQKSPKPDRKVKKKLPKPERKRSISIGENKNDKNVTGSPKKDRNRKLSTNEASSVTNEEKSDSKIGSFSRRERKGSTDGRAQRKPGLSPKERKRSTSESKQRKDKYQHHYRMHRIKFFDYEPQSINCIACDEKNNRLALSR